MSELYTPTLKYFYLAISEFLPYLKELQSKTEDKNIKEKLKDYIEDYNDILFKIDKYNLNYEEPNKFFDGEPIEIEIDIPDKMIENLSRLSHRMLISWKEKIEKLKNKDYLTDKNKEELSKLEHLVWPLEALLKEESYVLGKYAHMGPLEFPGENPKEEDSPINSLGLFLDEIKHCYVLGDQGLLESKKLDNLEASIRTDLGQIIEGLNNEVIKLKYKKINGGWRNVLKSGFHNRQTAEKTLDHWRILIEEIIDSIYGSNPQNEVYFSAGESFTAVKTLREILKSAKTKIWIEDNFLHPDTVRIIEPYINSALEVRFLTRSSGNKNFSSFCIDLQKFKSQYSDSSIEAKENNDCHDRYVIVDETDVYHSGQSFNDLGRKASQINKVEDELNKNKILKDFNNWWSTGNVI